MNNIEKKLLKNKEIFSTFSEIYLFGSSISNRKNPNDIDLLLIYKFYSQNITYERNKIIFHLKKIFNIDIDITILSENELYETNFLQNLNTMYKKIV